MKMYNYIPYKTKKNNNNFNNYMFSTRVCLVDLVLIQSLISYRTCKGNTV